MAALSSLAGYIGRGLRRQGNRRRAQEDWTGAAASFERYLRLVPRDAAIWIQLGHMRSQARQFAEADMAYRRADVLMPYDADLLLCWGHSRKDAGDRTRARELYGLSLALNGNSDAVAGLQALNPATKTPTERMENERQAAPGEMPPEPAGSAGCVEGMTGMTISGIVQPFSDEAPEIEIGISDRVLAAVRAQDRDGQWRFRTVIVGDAGERVHVRRRADGRELDGSPIAIAQAGAPVPAPAAGRFDIVRELTWIDGELALFVTHGRCGAIKPHVAAHVRALREQGIRVVLIIAADRPVHVEPDLLAATDGVIVRENAGYDFAAWAHAMAIEPRFYGASVLYLVNDSIVGPGSAAAFEAMIARIRASSADLIGLTQSQEYRWHIQSYFLALKPAVLGSDALQNFWHGTRSWQDKDDVIRASELIFASSMEDAGLKSEVLFPVSTPKNPTLYAWRELLEIGFPYLKLLLLRGSFNEPDVAGWQATADLHGFDVSWVTKAIDFGEAEVPTWADDRLYAHPIPDRASVGAPRVALFAPLIGVGSRGDMARALAAALRHTDLPLNLYTLPSEISLPLPSAVQLDFVGAPDVAIVPLSHDLEAGLDAEQRAAFDGAECRIGYQECGGATQDRQPGKSVRRIWAIDPPVQSPPVPAFVPVDRIDLPVTVPRSTVTDRAVLLEEAGLPLASRLLLVTCGQTDPTESDLDMLTDAWAVSNLDQRGWRLVVQVDHHACAARFSARYRDVAGLHVLNHLPSHWRGAAWRQAADIVIVSGDGVHARRRRMEAVASGKPVIGLREASSASATAFDKLHDGKPPPSPTVRALLMATTKVENGTLLTREATNLLDPSKIAERLRISIAAALAGREPASAVARIEGDVSMGCRFETWDPEGFVKIALMTDGAATESGLARLPAEEGGAWVVIAPAGTVVAPHAAALLRQEAVRMPWVSIFYADDVAFGATAAVDQLRLKPSFDPVLLAAKDYVGAPLFVRESVFRKMGGLRPERQTAACADLLFRAADAGLGIGRIPSVLLAHPGERPAPKPRHYRAMLNVQPSLAPYAITDGIVEGTFALRTRWPTTARPSVTLVVPTCRALAGDGTATHIDRLLEAVVNTDWPMDRLAVLIGDDRPELPRPASGLLPFSVRWIDTSREPGVAFNYAAKMNRLWREATTEQLVLMNDDALPIDPNWLEALQTFAVQPDTGGVGARLLFENGAVQHAGMAPLGLEVAHSWVFRQDASGSYQDWALVHRQCSVVTGAVFATRRSVLEQIGGFDERFALEFNDSDLCLRLRSLNYRIIYTPHAVLQHTEKASRGEKPPPGEDRARFRSRWLPWLRDDPCWHPYLRRDRIDAEAEPELGAWYRA